QTPLASERKLCVGRTSRVEFSTVANPFQRIRKPKAEIKKSGKTNGTVAVALGEPSARKVGLKPKSGWQKRNFLTEVLIPSIFAPRSVRQEVPVLPELKVGEIGITWIGHASFLVQTPEHNLLIDPNWAKWLK